jgi:hypothetical protein
MTENTTINNAQELSKKEKKAAREKAYREANKEKRAARDKAWREANKETIKKKVAASNKARYEVDREKSIAKSRAWQIANKHKRKEKIKDYNKAYYKANKETAAASTKAWQSANKERVAAVQREWHNKRIESDSLYKAKVCLRAAVHAAFKRIKQNKPANTQSCLGCTFNEAKAHFESLFQEGMSWNNHGEWHIDHIRPVASFGLDELDQMNHISNLQPLWAKDNFEKSDKWI